MMKAKWILPMMALAVLPSCGIYDDMEACLKANRVRFRFDNNVLRADAFGSQVNSVRLDVFDLSGQFIGSSYHERELSPDNDFHIDLDVPAGRYRLLAWCEGVPALAAANRFSLGDGSSITDFGAELPLDSYDGSSFSDNDIVPLFHGMTGEVACADEDGIHDVAVVSLTKDTNHVSVILQNVDGMPISADALTFEITGDNDVLEYDNAVSPSSSGFTYRPWATRPVVAEMPDDMARGTMADANVPSGVMAEFTLSRIMTDMPQKLVVRMAGDGREILNVSLVDCLLMVKGNYHASFSDQQYLDCLDDYTLMFFVDEGMTWIRSAIYINGWRVVPPQGGVM